VDQGRRIGHVASAGPAFQPRLSAHVLGFGYDRWRRFCIERWNRLSVAIRKRYATRQSARARAEVDRQNWHGANVRLADFLERIDRSRGSAESRTV
jgi:hypothetical protein